MRRHASLFIAALLLISLGCSRHHDTSAAGAMDSSPRPSLTAAATRSTTLTSLDQDRIADEQLRLASRGAVILDDGAENNDLGDVFFDFDSARLTAHAQATLQQYADRMRGQRSETLRIEGLCDRRGTLEYNLVLGERRALSVKEYLVDLGLSIEQLVTVSYGNTRLMCDREDEACYQSNRRAHLILLPSGPTTTTSPGPISPVVTRSGKSR